MENCSKCGQSIVNIVTIDGLPYGTTCAETVLGIKQFPAWFKGGDWNQAKQKNDKDVELAKKLFENRRSFTSNAWAEWNMLSKAFHKARYEKNEWAENFIRSIINQLGYFCVLASTEWNTMEEAEINWDKGTGLGSFPYLNGIDVPKKINNLSPKQLKLINTYL